MRLSLLLASVATLSGLASAQTVCNGQASFCSKKFSEIAYVTTHNSYASSDNAAQNQHYDIVQQLTDGVRGFMLDAHNPTGGANGTIELCHESCSLLDAGPLIPTLVKMKAWLDANPSEVITIFWENFDKFTPDKFVAAYQASGISSLVWTQAVGADWPTLATMIAANQRVVNYLDTGADYTVAAWLMAEYDFVFETPFDNQNASQFVCTIDRPKSPASPSTMMYVMNHFLYGLITLGGTAIEVPQPGSASVTNSEASLGVEATTCLSTFGRVPNYLAVDFYELGDSFQVAAALNNVTYVAKTLGGNSSTTTSSPTVVINNSAGGRLGGEWTGVVVAIAGVMAAWALL